MAKTVETVDMPTALTIGDEWRWRVPARGDFPASDYNLSFGFAGPATVNLTPGTNVIAQPNDLSHAYWTKTGGAVTKDVVRAPGAGTYIADLFLEDTSTGAHGIELATNLTITAGTIYACSVDVRAYAGSPARYFRLAFGDPDSAPYLVIDPTDGTTILSAAYNGILVDVAVLPLADDWYRLLLTARAGVTDTNVDIGLYLADATAAPPFHNAAEWSYTGVATAGVYLANVWMEAGLYEPSAWRISGADAGGWDVLVPKATTAGYTPGRYRWSAFVTEAATGSRYQVAAGWVVLQPNLAVLTGDNQTHAQKMLGYCEAALQARANGDIFAESVSIGGRSISKMSTMELMRLRGYYAAMVRREQSQDRLGLQTVGVNLVPPST